MAYTLSKYEKETVILYNQSNDCVMSIPREIAQHDRSN